MVVLCSNNSEDYDSIFIIDRDQQPIMLVKVPLICNIFEALTKSSTPQFKHLKGSIRFSAMKMLKNMDDSVLIFD